MTIEKKRSSVPVPKKIPANNKQGYKWRLVIEGPPDPVTNVRTQIPRVRDTIAEVKKACQEEYDRLAGGINVKKAKKVTVSEAAAEWRKKYIKTIDKDATLAIRDKSIKIINRYIGKLPIATLTKKQYQGMLDTMATVGYKVKDKENPGQFVYKPYAVNSIKTTHTAAGMILEWAVKEGLRKDDPSEGAVIKEKALTVEEIEEEDLEASYLERHELESFLNAVVNHGLERDLETFYFLAFTGLRSGELCALKWADINFDTTMIRVTKTLYSPNNNMKNYELTPPKTTGSIRSLNLDLAIINLLKSYQEQQTGIHEKYKAQFDDHHSKNFVLCRPNGYPYNPTNVLNRMDRILEYTNITKHATPHIFRHTHISMLAEAGVDIANIMKRVGHDDAKTTTKIYLHVTNKMKQDDANKVNIQYGDLLKLK
ncbi:tyrosine-type recombinase/integrase [Paenibacillus helianthi]|uniref:tyrosine-type recombinase/integrase n=1 Tax=Paenibacillus helianthi TaxID=1349432 RepID=UPI0009FA08F8|nr:site-specific integrase [Paenibacillus helianthi]